VDLKDFFADSRISGLNVVWICRQGSLTIVLDEVPWDQALESCAEQQLDKQLSGTATHRDTLHSQTKPRRSGSGKAQAEAIAPVTVTAYLVREGGYDGADAEEFLSFARRYSVHDRRIQVIIRASA